MNGARLRRIAMVGAAAVLVAACGGGDPAEELADQLAEQAIEEAGDDATVDLDIGDGSVDIDVDDENGDGSVSVDTDNDGSVAIEVEGEDGDGVVIIGGGSVPEGFPIPVPDGGEILSSISTSGEEGGGSSVVVQYPVGSFDELVATFETWMDGQGVDAAKTEMSTDEGKTVQLYASGEDDLGLVITVTDTGTEVVVSLLAGD
jgi:hypothetical protein